MSSVNILFYSNHCEGSKHLLSLMQGEKLTRFFHLICTDNNSKIPPQIKLTPTLIIRGVPTPYVAADAFAWFSKIKQWKINMNIQRASTAQQKYLQNINGNLDTNNHNVLNFSQAEMEGMSDIFAYLQEDNPVPHAYFNYNNLGNENIFAPPKEEDKYKINANKQKELQNNLEIARKKQDIDFKQKIDDFRNQYNGS